ncbi:hypothetical protein U1Q18_052181 [Sarracenia purpurea var. burkii]
MSHLYCVKLELSKIHYPQILATTCLAHSSKSGASKSGGGAMDMGSCQPRFAAVVQLTRQDAQHLNPSVIAALSREPTPPSSSELLASADEIPPSSKLSPLLKYPSIQSNFVCVVLTALFTAVAADVFVLHLQEDHHRLQLRAPSLMSSPKTRRLCQQQRSQTKGLCVTFTASVADRHQVPILQLVWCTCPAQELI